MKKKYVPKLSNINYPLVMIYWNDIESDSSWRDISDLLKDTLPLCISSGWLISDEKDIYKEDGLWYPKSTLTLDKRIQVAKNN